MLNPVVTLLSLTGEDQYHYDTVEALKQIIESFKTELDNVTLSFVDLRGANLQGAILIEANLQNAGLSGAILSRAYLKSALETNYSV